MEKIIEILSEIRPDIDFENQKHLVEGGYLDSFDIVSIISDLNDVFEINIRAADLKPENFNSVESIQDLVNFKKSELNNK